MTSSGMDANEYHDLKRLFEDVKLTKDVDSKIWMEQVRDKLYTMFCSHLNDEYINEAFKWAAELCMLTGDFTWISPNESWTPSEIKIFSCIVGRSLIELNALFPLFNRHINHGDEPKKDDRDKIIERSANPDDYDLFGYHLVLLESVIKTLVKWQSIEDDKEDGIGGDTISIFDNFDKNKLHYVLDRLREVMILVGEYLETVHSHWQSLIQQQDSLKFAATEGALRVMSVWLSEDPCFQPQKRDLIMDLMIKNLLLDGRPLDKDIIVLAIHSVCTQDEESHLVFRRAANHKEALEKYLEYTEEERKKSKNYSRSRKKFLFRCGLVKDLMRDET